MNEPTLDPEFKAFKDGVYDAIIYGDMNATRWEEIDVELCHYYKRGYDFGLTIHSDMIDNVPAVGYGLKYNKFRVRGRV